MLFTLGFAVGGFLIIVAVLFVLPPLVERYFGYGALPVQRHRRKRRTRLAGADSPEANDGLSDVAANEVPAEQSDAPVRATFMKAPMAPQASTSTDGAP